MKVKWDVKSVRLFVVLFHRRSGWLYVALPMLPFMSLPCWFIVSWISDDAGFADPL